MTVRDDQWRRRLERVLSVLYGAWGLALLTRPRQVADVLDPGFPDERTWVVRLLGARLVAQHGVLLTRPARAVVGVSTAVDLVHAASVLPLLASPRYRRAGLISAGTSTAYAALAAVLAPRR